MAKNINSFVQENDEILISIIIPTYNYGHLLDRAVKSVASQTNGHRFIETIIVNDGSTDNTAEVVNELKSYFYKNLTVIHKDNGGAASARNVGLKKSRGAYILFLDADDELAPGAIQAILNTIDKFPNFSILLGAHISVFPDGQEKLRHPTPVPTSNPRQLIIRYLLQKKISISHGCSLFNRDLLLQRPYPETLNKGEDIPVFAYLLISGKTITISQPLAKIHKHGSSLRHSRNNEENNALKMVEEVFSYLPPECQNLRDRYLAQRYLSLFRNALIHKEKSAIKSYYIKAIKKNWMVLFNLSYLRKAIRAFIFTTN